MRENQPIKVVNIGNNMKNINNNIEKNNIEKNVESNNENNIGHILSDNNHIIVVGTGNHQLVKLINFIGEFIKDNKRFIIVNNLKFNNLRETSKNVQIQANILYMELILEFFRKRNWEIYEKELKIEELISLSTIGLEKQQQIMKHIKCYKFIENGKSKNIELLIFDLLNLSQLEISIMLKIIDDFSINPYFFEKSIVLFRVNENFFEHEVNCFNINYYFKHGEKYRVQVLLNIDNLDVIKRKLPEILFNPAHIINI